MNIVHIILWKWNPPFFINKCSCILYYAFLFLNFAKILYDLWRVFIHGILNSFIIFISILWNCAVIFLILCPGWIINWGPGYYFFSNFRVRQKILQTYGTPKAANGVTDEYIIYTETEVRRGAIRLFDIRATSQTRPYSYSA